MRFDPVHLKSELVALYCEAEFYRNVNELHEYIWQQELGDVFPQTYKIAKLILTIPATNVSTERSFSALKRIKIYAQHPGPRMTVILVTAEHRKSSAG
jgi:hypothetical protein